MPWQGVAFIGGALALVGVVAYVQHWREKNRSKQLQVLAGTLGLDFSPGPNTLLTRPLETFSLFNQGRERTAWNVMTGGTEDERLLLFDYRYTVGTGKHKQTVKRTVVCFESTQLDVPQFEIRPETWFDKITQLFGVQEVDLENFPEFSKRYYLVGNPKRMAQLFTEPLVRKFESLRDVAAAGHGKQLVFYRMGHRANVENFRTLMEDAYAVYALLKQGLAQPESA
jgi:hypothetical protein